MIFTVSQINESFYRLGRAPEPEGHSCNAIYTNDRGPILSSRPFPFSDPLTSTLANTYPQEVGDPLVSRGERGRSLGQEGIEMTSFSRNAGNPRSEHLGCRLGTEAREEKGEQQTVRDGSGLRCFSLLKISRSHYMVLTSTKCEHN